MPARLRAAEANATAAWSDRYGASSRAACAQPIKSDRLIKDFETGWNTNGQRGSERILESAPHLTCRLDDDLQFALLVVFADEIADDIR